MVLFEVPTGIVADTVGRRASYLLGTVTLPVATLLYVLLWQIQAPFWAWALASLVLGLGFTFFSGAVEAWLVDALTATGFDGDLETVFGRGQIVGGAAMLTGSLAGGVLAQQISLGVPFVVRGGDPRGDVRRRVRVDARHRLHAADAEAAAGRDAQDRVRSIDYGWRVPAGGG